MTCGAQCNACGGGGGVQATLREFCAHLLLHSHFPLSSKVVKKRAGFEHTGHTTASTNHDQLLIFCFSATSTNALCPMRQKKSGTSVHLSFFGHAEGYVMVVCFKSEGSLQFSMVPLFHGCIRGEGAATPSLLSIRGMPLE